MKRRFLLIASFPESIIPFRGALIEALIRSGCEVHVAAPSLKQGSEVALSLKEIGAVPHEVPISRTGMNVFSDIKTFLCLAFIIINIRPFFVMAYTVKPVVYGLVAAWLMRVPQRFALITGLGYVFQSHPENSRLVMLVRKLYRLSLSRSNKVFFQNPDDEILFRQLNVIPEHIPSQIVNGSGVETGFFLATPLPPPPLRFLLIARLLGDKGVREYVSAARLVREKYADTRFYLVGWIDENPDAISQNELDRWTSEGTVEYIGRLKDVRSALSEASVYVLPSYREGTPRTVLEAMAMGRAVITTNAPGCRETVVDGDNGFLVPVKDVNALANAMMKMLDDPGMVVRMGERSREIAESKYDVHSVNAAMLEGMGIQ